MECRNNFSCIYLYMDKYEHNYYISLYKRAPDVSKRLCEDGISHHRASLFILQLKIEEHAHDIEHVSWLSSD